MSNPVATILVVDDDQFTAELIGVLLETVGYNVEIAEGGVDALEKMTSNPDICMVIADMNMPFIDGIQLYAELRENGYRQPFVLLTGQDAAPLRLARPGMDAVLTKDENLQDTLPETVEMLLLRG